MKAARLVSMLWVTVIASACSSPSDASGDDGGGGGGDAGVGVDGGGDGGDAGEPITFGVDGWWPSSGLTPHYFVQPDELFRVHPTRPRLYFRADDVEGIKARAAGPLKDRWEYLGWMASSMAALAPNSTTATQDVKGWFGDKGEAVAIRGLFDDNQAYIDWAIAWAKALSAGPVPSDDTPLRARTQRLATVYDWLYDKMSAADREIVRAGLVKYVEAVGDLGYISNPGYLGGHERWGLGVYAMGLIALHGDYEPAEAKLREIREHIARGLFPTQAFIGADGGYHMGWAYTPSYTNFDMPYLIWTIGTNDVLLDDWISNTGLWYVYGARGDDAFPEVGDAFSISPDIASKNIIYTAGIGKRGDARWFLESKIGADAEVWLQLLMLDPGVAPAPPDALPLGRLFRQSGTVIARDRWDGATTHFMFKSGSYVSTNHHHRDENAFTLHYKGLLAVDAGVYDSYGSTHWRNYYTRTVAHNGITVFDPAQQMKLYGAAVSNDGGQVFKTEPTRLEDVQPGGDAYLDGIRAFETTDAFTYALGDATRAYDPARVTLAQRDVVYLRQTGRPHPVVLIFDRVGAAQAGFKKSFLLHTAAQPTLGGKTMVARHRGGRLTSMTLFPTNATLALVGGAGKEYWVDGQNYAPTTTKLTPGTHRLEVSPGTPATNDNFLHALFVDDDTAPAVAATDARLVTGTGAVGATVGGWTVVFPRAAGIASALSYTTAASGTSTHLVTGLAPGTTVHFRTGGTDRGAAVVGPGGCAKLAFDAPAGTVVDVAP